MGTLRERGHPPRGHPSPLGPPFPFGVTLPLFPFGATPPLWGHLSPAVPAVPSPSPVQLLAGGDRDPRAVSPGPQQEVPPPHAPLQEPLGLGASHLEITAGDPGDPRVSPPCHPRPHRDSPGRAGLDSSEDGDPPQALRPPRPPTHGSEGAGDTEPAGDTGVTCGTGVPGVTGPAGDTGVPEARDVPGVAALSLRSSRRASSSWKMCPGSSSRSGGSFFCEGRGHTRRGGTEGSRHPETPRAQPRAHLAHGQDESSPHLLRLPALHLPGDTGT